MISGVCSLINGLITAGSWFVCANKSWWLVVNNNGNRRNWVRVLTMTGTKILLHNQSLGESGTRQITYSYQLFHCQFVYISGFIGASTSQ